MFNPNLVKDYPSWIPNRKPNKLCIAVGNNPPDLFRLQRISDKATKQAEYGNINTLQASDRRVKPGWGELTPVYYRSVWPLTSLTCTRPRCPPLSYQTANGSAAMLSDAADVWLSGCLIRHFPPFIHQSCGSFSRNTGMQMRRGEAKNSIHSFFSLNSMQRGRRRRFVFFCGAAVCRWMEDVFIINGLGPVWNRCSPTFVTFSGVNLAQRLFDFRVTSQNTLVRNKSYYEMVEWSKQILKWREKLLDTSWVWAWRGKPGRWEFSQGNRCRGGQTPNGKLLGENLHMNDRRGSTQPTRWVA